MSDYTMKNLNQGIIRCQHGVDVEKFTCHICTDNKLLQPPMTFKKDKNIAIVLKEVTPDLEWKDISHEVYRVYIFPGDDYVKIINPVKLNISESGGHRITDEQNVGHYIPYGWIHIAWETNDNNIMRF